MTMDNKLLNAALTYAQYGWAVHPLQPRTKQPATQHGCSDATTDEMTIRQWWTQWPAANVGVNVGKSELLVIDVDPRHGGDETWREMQKKHGINDDTVTSLTGGGGVHLLYSINGADFGTLKASLGDGLDVKRGNSYIVCPPSVHPNGQTYEWELSGHPGDASPIPLPPSLLYLLTDGDADEKPKPAPAVEGQIPAGGRNAALTSLGGTMRRRGMGETEILAALVAVNAGRCDPPLAKDEVERIAQSVARYLPSATIPSRLGARLSGKVADAVASAAPASPDPGLRDRITEALLERTQDGKHLRPAILRRRKAGELLLTWLARSGGFVQSETGRLHYFSRSEKRLYDLATPRWAGWLYALTGTNPAGTDYAFLHADCKTMAMNAPRLPVLRVAAWDEVTQVLRVSRFDGTVYVLDGERITEEPNGENVIFDDDPLWLPYNPDFSTPGALHWATTGLPHWDGDGETYGLAFRAWVLTSFFTEICPARPLLVFLGEKGSGKSMALRVLLKELFGPIAQVSGIPDKPDGFTAAAAAAHVLVLDNLDRWVGWLRDKLARIATGADDHYRQLYTSNEMGRVVYRCWLAFTARTPDTLKRDDLADRLLLLPVARIDDAARRKETDLLAEAMAARDDWWGDVLTAANRAVASIRGGALFGPSRLRMADWEALGRIIARNEGREGVWNEFCEGLKRAQSDFLLEGDLIVEGLEKWLADEANDGREVTARELYQELTDLLFEDRRPPADWPKRSIGFGRRLAGIRRELQTFFDVEWGKGNVEGKRNRAVYQFGVKQ